MKTFKDFLSESLLIEDKVSDLEKSNPSIPVRDYASIDKTPTKKFLPWLVNQHKKGNVTPDHPKLKQTIENFDKTKARHGISDHSQHTFHDIANAVEPHIGQSRASKKQSGISGVETIHNENGISAHHIKTKEASQQLYGGGDSRGGEKGGARGTSWCVSARSGGCRFGDYGKMYTIHDPKDNNAPYAVHPDKGTITSRYNNGDKDISHVISKTPHIRGAVNSIIDHHLKGSSERKKIEYKLNHNLHTKEELHDLVSHPDKGIRITALNHPSTHPDVVKKALDGKEHLDVKTEVVENTPHAEVLDHVLKGNNDTLKKAVFRNPNHNYYHVSKALMDNHSTPVKLAAIKSHKLAPSHISHVIQNPGNGAVKSELMKQKYIHIGDDEFDKLFNDPNLEVRKDILKHAHPIISQRFKDHAIDNNDHGIMNHMLSTGDYHRRKEVVDKLVNSNDNHRANLLTHHSYMLGPEHIHSMLKNGNQKVKEMAIKHPGATSEHLHNALDGNNKELKVAALRNPNIDSTHIQKAMHPNQPKIVQTIAKHSTPKVFNPTN